jgi:hypothetical protein
MSKHVTKIFTGLAIATFAFTGLPNRTNAETIYGVTNLQQLVSFDSTTRAVTSTVGLPGFSLLGELLLSIDVRPATGELYGLSSLNNIYKIDPMTGARAQIGATLSPAPTGGLKAIDFNPTVDRIRVLGSSGAVTNLRVHPDTGAVTEDVDLAFLAGDANAGETPAVVNGAYTNSVAGATTTMLYNLEAGNDILTTQTPANDGTLSTVGSLAVNLATSGGFTGFDISGATGTAYLVGNNLVGGITTNALYTVNLATGMATSVGAVTGVNGSFRDIAVASAVVPEPVTLVMAAAPIAFLAVRRRWR